MDEMAGIELTPLGIVEFTPAEPFASLSRLGLNVIPTTWLGIRDSDL